MVTEFYEARIILIIISMVMIIGLTKIKLQDRLGTQFFIVVILFWFGVFVVALAPNIIDIILNFTFLENRAQFLLLISIPIIIYLLYQQSVKNKNLSLNFRKVVRDIALVNFKKNIQILSDEKIELLIIIAAKNESDTIGSVIDKIQELKLELSYKILVINDGSSDNTESIAEKKGAIILSHFYNLGIGAAIKSGFFASQFLKPKMIINIDGDGQHDPKSIPQIILKINEGADLVYASRFTQKNSYQTSKIRLVGNKFYNNLVNKIGNLSLSDVTSGYRGIRFEKLESILFISETNFAIELALRASKNHLKIVEIPTIMTTRNFGQSQFHRLEKFMVYNFNAVVQIFNAYMRTETLPDNK